MFGRRTLVLGLLLACLASSPRARAASPEAKRLYDVAVTAYQAKDYSGFLAAAKKMLALEPENPKYIYNVACAEALTGDTAGASRHLTALLGKGLSFGVEDDADLAALRASKDFEPVRKLLDRLKEPVSSSQVAFSLPEKDQIPEGIAYDPSSRTWFVSSVHKRKIVARAEDGKISDFATTGQDGLWSVLALGVDSRRGWLWACTAALPEMDGYDKSQKGLTGVFKYDLATRKLLGKYLLPQGATTRALGDMAIGSGGDLYLTDGAGSGIYRVLRSKDRIEEFVPPGVFLSPQGIVFAEGEKTLLVADYSGGITAIDVASGSRRPLAPPDNASLIGIDGMVRRGSSLIVTQNGIRPHRVTRLLLDSREEKVVSGEILEMNNPGFSEPTLGTIVGDAYYYVANSQWGMFDGEGKLAPMEKLAGPSILRITLRGR
jgi:sugar lactone lactonase YvrE